METAKHPRLWTPGDWNAFFGFGTNILVNLLAYVPLGLFLALWLRARLGLVTAVLLSIVLAAASASRSRRCSRPCQAGYRPCSTG